METSGVLAQRKISARERGQKAAAFLVLTFAALGLLWFCSDGRLLTHRAWMFWAGLVCVLGIAAAMRAGLRTGESARSKEASRLLRMRIEDDREGRSWVLRLPFHARLMLARLIVAAGLLGVVAGAGLLAWQAYIFLSADYWPRLSLLQFARQFVPWLAAPQSWLQLHELAAALLDLVPASVAAVFAGLLVAGAGNALLARFRLAGWRRT
jgi:hypothetical protein